MIYKSTVYITWLFQINIIELSNIFAFSIEYIWIPHYHPKSYSRIITLSIMQSLTCLIAALASFSPTLAAPTKFATRASSVCDAFSNVVAGSYQVENDAWGSASGTGSQCAQIDGLTGNSLAWSTTFSWADNPNSVKSYANAYSPSGTPCKPLNQFNSIPTTWEWRYVLSLKSSYFSCKEQQTSSRAAFDRFTDKFDSYSTSITGDVSYDAFLATSCDDPGDAHVYEVMVWLATLGGLNPIGTLQSTVQIGGASYNLWSGMNGATTVYSFVAATTTNSFKGDLMNFFNYLKDNKGVDTTLNLSSVQAGTEVSIGNAAKFITSRFTISSS